MTTTGAHLIRVDRRWNFTSDTLDPAELGQLEAVSRSSRWYQDRWALSAARDAALALLAPDRPGLVLLGPKLQFDVPPPFPDMFEPIALDGPYGDSTGPIRALSGSAPTRQERKLRMALTFGVVIG